jgi:peptide/nickel transport system ATP-binding protein
MALLEVSGLSVEYRVRGIHRAALKDVTFTLEQGKTVALVGESGSGKSTLAKTIVGLLPSNAGVRTGTVHLAGTSLLGLRPRAWRRLRGSAIGYVPQDPVASLNPVRPIGSQLAEPLVVHGIHDRKAVRTAVLEALAAVGIHAPQRVAGLYPHELSGGMLQRVLIAGAISLQPQLLLADEPTSALDVSVQKRILDLLESLQSSFRFATLLITHDLALAAERANDVVVLFNGRVQEVGAAAQVLTKPQAEYTRQLLADVPKGRLVEASAHPATAAAGDGGTGAPSLEVREITKIFPGRRGGGAVRALSGVSFAIHRGTTHALVGESGSGKSTLARIAARLTPQTSGEVLVNGERIESVKHAELRELRRTVQFIYQSPFDALDSRQSVGSILAEPLKRYQIGDKAWRVQRVRELADSVALSGNLLTSQAAQLSGGQLQRVAIARALALEPTTLILDEPTSALDVTVQARVLRLLAQLQAELGLTYLFISHDLEVVRTIADTVTVLRHGQVVESGAVGDVFDNPADAYTQELVAAAPRLEPRARGTARV